MKHTKRRARLPKKVQQQKQISALPLEEGIPMPSRGENIETFKLKNLIRGTVPFMEVIKHSFVIDKSKAHTVNKFLKDEYPEMAFKIGKILDNPNKMRIWRKK